MPTTSPFAEARVAHARTDAERQLLGDGVGGAPRRRRRRPPSRRGASRRRSARPADPPPISRREARGLAHAVAVDPPVRARTRDRAAPGRASARRSTGGAPPRSPPRSFIDRACGKTPFLHAGEEHGRETPRPLGRVEGHQRHARRHSSFSSSMSATRATLSRNPRASGSNRRACSPPAAWISSSRFSRPRLASRASAPRLQRRAIARNVRAAGR